MIEKICQGTSALLLAVLISGCATMNPEECKRANWHEIGLRDGLDGQMTTLLEARAKDCAEAHVTVDSQAYRLGRERGLSTYCRIENAAPLGIGGGTYEGVCPPHIDGEFRYRFQLGHAIHERRAVIDRLNGRVESLERKLQATHHDESKALNDIANEDDRKRIRREFEDRRHRLRDELRDLDQNLRRSREQLRTAEFSLGELR